MGSPRDTDAFYDDGDDFAQFPAEEEKSISLAAKMPKDDSPICPITLENLISIDVENRLGAPDGRVYEKDAIEEWIRENPRSPFNEKIYLISEKLFVPVAFNESLTYIAKLRRENGHLKCEKEALALNLATQRGKKEKYKKQLAATSSELSEAKTKINTQKATITGLKRRLQEAEPATVPVRFAAVAPIPVRVAAAPAAAAQTEKKSRTTPHSLFRPKTAARKVAFSQRRADTPRPGF